MTNVTKPITVLGKFVYKAEAPVSVPFFFLGESHTYITTLGYIYIPTKYDIPMAFHENLTGKFTRSHHG